MPGGPLAIDLLNTTWDPGDGRVDWLDDDDAVRTFSNEYERSLTRDQVAQARIALVEARDLIRRIFLAPDPTTPELRYEMNRLLANASVEVARTADGPAISVSSSDNTRSLAVEAVVDAIELTGRQPERIRACQHDKCMLWFLDTSKAGRRRWCSMERCGNRVKARRHYAKTATITASDA